MRRVAFRILWLLVAISMGFLIVLYSLQDRLIFPGNSTQGQPDAKVAPKPGTELVRLTTAEGEPVTALYGAALRSDGQPDPEPSSRPALIYFYGNAMCLAYCDPEFDRFRRLGLNVLIPDYLGYGLSGGKASEKGCRQTGESCLHWLLNRGFPIERIIVGGWSLGGAVAIDLAYRHPVGGLMAFSSFTSIKEMSRSIVPLGLPDFLFAHKFDNLSKLPFLTCPILLGHGRRDRLVPFPMHARLAAAARAPLSSFVVESAEHNDFFDIGGRRIDQAVATFIEQLDQRR